MPFNIFAFSYTGYYKCVFSFRLIKIYVTIGKSRFGFKNFCGFCLAILWSCYFCNNSTNTNECRKAQLVIKPTASISEKENAKYFSHDKVEIGK